MSFSFKSAADRLFSIRNATQEATQAIARTPEEIQDMIRAGGEASAVNDATAMRVGAVFACVRLLADSVAMLPASLYRREGDALRIDPNNPVHQLLALRPTPRHTPFVFWRMVITHLLLRGNFYAQKVMRKGYVDTLIPLNPDKIEVISEDGITVQYVYDKGKGRKITFSSKEIFHITGLSVDGFRGLSVLSAARNAVRLSIDAEKYGQSLFQNGARPSGVLSHPGTLSGEALERLRADVESRTSGVENANRLLLLEEGLTWSQMSLTAEDSQFLQSRSFQRAEICMFFGVPPHMVGDLDKGTSWGTGIEQQNLGFLTHTLRPYLINIQQACVRDLLPESERANYVAKFDVSDLTKADFVNRQNGLQVMRRNGVINANEWRKSEGLDPIQDEKANEYITDLSSSEDAEPQPASDGKV